MAVVGQWTYSGDPADSDMDAVRFLVQDVNESDQKVSNEEITWMLTTSGNVYLAAADVAVAIAAVYGSKSSKSIGSLSVTYAEQNKAYEALSQRLRILGSSPSKLSLSSIYAGGISKADKARQEADTDWVEPDFKVGMWDVGATAGGSSSS